jgi:hypothetical protein
VEQTVDEPAAACLVGLAMGAGLVACGTGMDATAAAEEAMAEALASGQFDDVPLANATPGDVGAAVAEMTSGMGCRTERWIW